MVPQACFKLMYL